VIFGWPNGIDKLPPDPIKGGTTSDDWTWYSFAQKNGEYCRFVYVKWKGQISAAEYSPEGKLINSNATLPPGAGGLFPRREGNQVALLPAGEEVFRTLIESIESAAQSVHIATFILGNDRTGKAILDALTRKAREGLQVRVLLDAIGSRRISKRSLAPLKAAGASNRSCDYSSRDPRCTPECSDPGPGRRLPEPRSPCMRPENNPCALKKALGQR
jgi:phosphatidylserine/phosphatidylglycerophosphate/cardiolipin synthase-like enzyme